MKITACIVSEKVLNQISTSSKGYVVSIFDRSFNIEIYDKFLINIGLDRLPVTPRSILVPAEEFYNLILPRLHLGSCVVCSRGSVYIPAVKLCISTRTSPKFNPKLELSGDILPDSQIKKNLIEASKSVKLERRYFDRVAPSPLSDYFLLRFSFIDNPKSKQLDEMKLHSCGKDNINFHFRETLWARIDSMLLAMRQYALADVLDSARGILGLGSGLTPSGDDFLAGFVSTGAILGSVFKDVDEFVSMTIRMVARESKGRTTDVSISMIEDACNGEIAEPAINFIRATVQKDNVDEIKMFARELISIGGTSGEDLFNGVATGILFFMKWHADFLQKHIWLNSRLNVAAGK